MSTDLPEPETAAAAPDATPDVKMVPVPVLATCRPPRVPAMAIVPALDSSKQASNVNAISCSQGLHLKHQCDLVCEAPA